MVLDIKIDPPPGHTHARALQINRVLTSCSANNHTHVVIPISLIPTPFVIELHLQSQCQETLVGKIPHHPIAIPSCKPHVSPSIVEPQCQTAGSDEKQQRGIGPMSSRVTLLLLIRLVDPHADDLAGGAERDVHGNGQAYGCGRVEVAAQPAEKWRDTRERPRGRNDQASVSLLVRRGREESRSHEPGGTDGAENGGMERAGVEMVGGP